MFYPFILGLFQMIVDISRENKSNWMPDFGILKISLHTVTTSLQAEAWGGGSVWGGSIPVTLHLQGHPRQLIVLLFNRVSQESTVNFWTEMIQD